MKALTRHAKNACRPLPQAGEVKIFVIVKGENVMNRATHTLIEAYYHAFNAGDMDAFFSLLDDHVVHDINQGKRQMGKDEFQEFMTHMNQCYKETLSHIIIMTNEAGTHAAAEFIVEGTYLQSDKGLPPARNQSYRLPAGAFFQIQQNKISRITTYYNLQEWIKQVS